MGVLRGNASLLPLKMIDAQGEVIKTTMENLEGNKFDNDYQPKNQELFNRTDTVQFRWISARLLLR